MDPLLKQVRRARWWLGVQRFLGVIGWCLLVTLSVALVAVVIDKFHPLGVSVWIWGVASAGMGVLAAIVWAAVSGRGLVDAAIELDRRCGLKERVSSSLAMSAEERDSELGQALVADALRRVERIDLGEHFYVRPSRQLLLPLVPAAAVVLVALLVNPAAVGTPGAAQAGSATKQIRKSSDSLRRKLLKQRKQAQKQGLKDAEELFRRLERDADRLPEKTEGDRKKALIKFNDLARELQKRRENLGGAEELQKQFKQLKDIGQGPADKLLDEIRRGNFQKAVEQLEKLKQDLTKGNLTPEEQKELAKQLGEMEKKLKQLVEAQREAQKDLENRIRQAQQAGQPEEASKLQEQLDKLRQQTPQLDQLDQLAEKLGQCSQRLNQGQLKDAADQLGQLQAGLGNLESHLQELQMLDEAMDQLARGRSQMTCPHCNGEGCEACQGEQPGAGLGRGRGIGARPEAKDDVKFYDTRSAVKVGRGAASVVGEVDGPNLRGNVQEQIRQQFESARREAADPLTDQHMPRQRRQHALEYFDRLREGK